MEASQTQKIHIIFIDFFVSIVYDKLANYGKTPMNKMKEVTIAQAMKEFEQAVTTKDIKRIADTDMRFHDVIYEATRNPKLVNILNNLREQMYRYRLEYLKDEENSDVHIGIDI